MEKEAEQKLQAKIVHMVPEHRVQDVVHAVSEVVTETIDTQTEKNISTVKQNLLGRRMKYAETQEVMSETGMTLQEIREWNAYSDGYNDRAENLEKQLFPDESGEVVEEEKV